jgi:hypothetical protein
VVGWLCVGGSIIFSVIESGITLFPRLIVLKVSKGKDCVDVTDNLRIETIT